MPEPLTRAGTPFALPSFRSLIYFAGDLNDAIVGEAVVGLLDLFVASWGERAAWCAIADNQRPMRPAPFEEAFVEDAHGWLREADKSWPATLRVSGPVDEEMAATTTPAFRADQYQFAMLEMSVPAEGDDLVRFADAATDILRPAPLLSGVMGFGYFLPTANESLIDLLPVAFRRYRAAIEPMLQGPADGQRKTDSGFPWDEYPDLPGIADIGWRTFVGAELLDRLGDVGDLSASGVALESLPDKRILTAGAAPIWGDVEAGEDLSAYRAVARALAPVRYPREVAYRSLFAAQDDADCRARIDAYLDRYEL